MSDVIYSIRYVCRYARVASWHSSQPPPVLQREKCRENDVGLYLFHVFSLPSFHPPFSYSPYPSAPLTRASYHPPSTLRRGHRVIRPLALPPPRVTLSALDRKSMFFSSRLRSIAVQRQFVSSSQLHRMIVSSLRQNRTV